MTWFAFRGYPTMDVASVQEKELVALGFHGYPTKATAEQHPNSVGFWQVPILDLMEKDYAYAVASGEQPGGPNANFLNPANALSGAAQASGLSGIADFFHRLTEANTWIRVGEVLLGVILVWVGANAVMRDTAAGNVVKQTEKTVGRVGRKVIPK